MRVDQRSEEEVKGHPTHLYKYILMPDCRGHYDLSLD